MKLFELFKTLAEIDSPSGKESQISKFVIGFCRKRGVDLKIDNYGNLYFPNINSKLLLTAHLDTVQEDSHIEIVIKDGIIQSKGNTILGADDKANLAGILYIIDTYYQNKQEIDFEVLFTVEEELGMRGVKNFDVSNLYSKNAISFDKAGVPFGTIINKAPFGVRIFIEIIGKAAHASTPSIGINSLKILSEFIANIPLGGDHNDVTLNFGLIRGGETHNTVPEKIVLEGDSRSFMESEIDKVIEKIKISLENLSEKYNSKYNLKVEKVIDGYEIEMNKSFMKVIAKSISEIVGKVELTSTLGGSDANILNKNNIETILISSGAQNVHTSDENISLENLENIPKTIKSILKRM